MMKNMITICASLLLACRVGAQEVQPTSKQETPPAADSRPLVMFVGDSLTVGTRSHPNAGKYPRWSYVEALRVLTDKRGPFRHDKRCGGGQSICGQFRGLLGMARGVLLGGRTGKPVEGLAYLVFQDSATGHMPTPEEYEPALREIVGFAAQRPDVKLILCTTAFERRKEGNELSAVWAKINEVMLRVAAEKDLGVIRQDIYWQRYIDWYLAKKLPLAQEKIWRLTGERIDSVHPGTVGAVFMAMQIARDLGIAAEQLDMEHPDLPISREQATEIRDFVYSWSEPTVVTPAKLPR